MTDDERVEMVARAIDPDETEGRALYRAKAATEARIQIGMSRKVRLTALSRPGEGT